MHNINVCQCTSRHFSKKKKKSINLTKKMLMEGLSAHYDKIRGEILLGFKVKGDIATALYFRPPCARAGGWGGRGG